MYITVFAVKAIGGVKPYFLQVDLFFIKFLLSFKMLFTVLKNSNYFLRYDQSKSSRTTGSLWEGETKTAKKEYFI